MPSEQTLPTLVQFNLTAASGTNDGVEPIKNAAERSLEQMKKVKIDYGRLTAAKLVERAQVVSEGLKDNDNFPALPITLDAINAKTQQTLQAAINAENNDREMLAILRQEKLELADMLRTTAEYVNTTAAGDEAKLLSSGFVITKTPEKHHLPGSIEKIAAKFTNLPQSIELQWSRSKNASYYQVYISADSGITWTLQSSVFGRKLMLNALVSGTRYQLKVIPVNKAGKGEASDVASQIAA